MYTLTVTRRKDPVISIRGLPAFDHVDVAQILTRVEADYAFAYTSNERTINIHFNLR